MVNTGQYAFLPLREEQQQQCSSMKLHAEAHRRTIRPVDLRASQHEVLPSSNIRSQVHSWASRRPATLEKSGGHRPVAEPSLYSRNMFCMDTDPHTPQIQLDHGKASRLLEGFPVMNHSSCSVQLPKFELRGQAHEERDRSTDHVKTS